MYNDKRITCEEHPRNILADEFSCSPGWRILRSRCDDATTVPDNSTRTSKDYRVNRLLNRTNILVRGTRPSTISSINVNGPMKLRDTAGYVPAVTGKNVG